jgi:hypothetical protein
LSSFRVDLAGNVYNVVETFCVNCEAYSIQSCRSYLGRALLPHTKCRHHRYRPQGRRVCCVFNPHSTHKMQPLDVSFMSPLKSYYGQEIEMWLKHIRAVLLHPTKLHLWWERHIYDLQS